MPPRRKLVLDHLHLVEKIARRVAITLPVSVELDDMIQAGRVGLMHAAERFDKRKGVPFHQYAQFRIKGAILDTFNRRNYQYELHAELPTEPMPDESSEGAVFSGLHMTPQGLQDKGPSPEQQLERREMVSRLRAALETLDPEERYAAMANADGVSYREIGEHFGHSTSWAFLRVQDAQRKLARSMAMYRPNLLRRAS